MSPANDLGTLAQSIRESTRRMQARRERLSEAKEALSEARDIDGLYREIDRLRLHLTCVISLLIRSGAVTKETYSAVAAAIDQADGVSDGMFSGTILADGTATTGTQDDDLALRELAQAIREMSADTQ